MPGALAPPGPPAVPPCVGGRVCCFRGTHLPFPRKRDGFGQSAQRHVRVLAPKGGNPQQLVCLVRRSELSGPPGRHGLNRPVLACNHPARSWGPPSGGYVVKPPRSHGGVVGVVRGCEEVLWWKFKVSGQQPFKYHLPPAGARITPRLVSKGRPEGFVSIHAKHHHSAL